jgi:DNA polymerase III subunit gamma/tau
VAAYVVLARKWRPAQFTDIVGQGPIVRTMMNAISMDRIHQAYLLTGSRGIGKTSIARIFAKAVRCEHIERGENLLRSCDKCASCKEITTSTSVDVIEIDGASNNGVDAVREIRENAKFLPASGAKKIYIIDEVHMLTTAAFNALLKTLEEPPPHVIFIFATTEPHKIPATILSRCQRFDLKRVTIAQIQTRLQEITKAEGIEAETGAIALLARAAEGSMRDALSLLDQVIAFAGTKITIQSVRDSVGLIEGQTLLGMLSAVFARKPMEALILVDQAYQQGHDLRVLTRSLIELLHGAILAKVGAAGSTSLELSLELSDDEWKELQTIAELRTLEEIELIFQVLHHGVEWIARSPQPKIVLDVLLVKCATAEALVSLDAMASNGTPTSTTSGAPGGANDHTQGSSTNVAPTAPVPTTESTDAAWEGFTAFIRQTRPLLASILDHGHCEALPSERTEHTLSICFRPQDAYFREQLQSRAYSEQLSSFSKEYFKHHVRIRVELKETGESIALRREREKKEKETAARLAVQNHPIIAEAKSLFGGELGPIEVADVQS